MFPLLETAIAFAAAMLAASLFVSALVHGLQSLGQYRSEIVAQMLKSVFHGFRSFYNDKEVLTADYPRSANPPPTLEQCRALRARVLETEQEFVQDVLSDPSLHARQDGASYGGEPEALARSVEYVGASDLLTIVRNQAESEHAMRESPRLASRVSNPSEPPPPESGEEPERLRSRDEKLFLPAEWFFSKNDNRSSKDLSEQKPFATVAQFADYLQRWFPTFEATASETFKRKIRRLTLVVSCLVVVLFNFDGLQLASRLYRDTGARSSYLERVPDLQQRAARMGIQTADVQPVQPSASSPADGSAQLGALLGALDDPSLGIGWQGSAVVDKWCAFTGKCPSSSGAIGGMQLASATLAWVLGLLFSCVMLSMGAPFWYQTLAGLLKLKNTVQVQKQAAEAATQDEADRKSPAASTTSAPAKRVA